MNHSTTIWLAWDGAPSDPFAPLTEGFSIAQEEGSIHLDLDQEDPFWPMPSGRFVSYEISRIPMDVLIQDPFAPTSESAQLWTTSPADWFPAPFALSSDLDPFFPGGPRVAVWFLIVVYLVVWSGACLGWQRWKRRRLAADQGTELPIEESS